MFHQRYDRFHLFGYDSALTPLLFDRVGGGHRGPQSFLTTVVARLPLDWLKAAYRKRDE